MFAEDQVGFLAASMSMLGFVCSVSGLQFFPLKRYAVSFHAGAVWQGGTMMDRRLKSEIAQLELSDLSIVTF